VLTDDTGPSAADKVTSDRTPALVFTFSEPVFGQADDIAVMDPYGAGVAPDSVTGWGTDTLAVALTTPLTLDGSYAVTLKGTATLRDHVGNPLNGGADEVVTFILDTTAPVVTVDGLTTTDTTPELTGGVDDLSAAVRVTVNGRDYDATNNGDGTWTLADDTISPALEGGTYDVTVTATDAAGNVGTEVGTGALIIRTEPVQVAVDTLVRTTLGSTRYDLRTGRTSVLMTITNVSQTVIRGPLWVVITSISDPGITLAGSSGITADNYLYVDVSNLLSGGRLEPGQSVSVWLSFNNPLRRRFNFLYSIRGVL
jgi:hypothetical protein